MILVDTSVWVDHLRVGEPALATALDGGRVLMHPFVLGELACGNLKNRAHVLQLLGALPSAPIAADSETLELIERRALMGQGIGYIDALRIPANVNGHSGEGEHRNFLTHHESRFIPWVFTFSQFHASAFASIRHSMPIGGHCA